MYEKIKTFIPLIIALLLSSIVIYWAVMMTLTVNNTRMNTIKNSQVIGEIITFIQPLETNK